MSTVITQSQPTPHRSYHNRSHADIYSAIPFVDNEAGFDQGMGSDRLVPTGVESSLVVIDARVDKADWLAARVMPGMQVLQLRSQSNGSDPTQIGSIKGSIAQITQRLRENPNIRHLVLVAHGMSGSLTLAGTLFDRESLLCCDADGSVDWQLWQRRLSTLSLYSCGVAAGTLGHDFVQTLHRKSGVAIAAATGYVGHASRGGTWELDVWMGDRSKVESLPQPFRPEVQQNYPGLLATLVVNSAADTSVAGDGLVTLREAIAAANGDTTTDLGNIGAGPDTIVFDPALEGSTISLTQGELAIGSNVTIDASAAPNLVISGNNTSRVFNITSGTTSLIALTVANGSAANGAGIRVDGATLNLERSLVTANTDSASGGGIYGTNANLSLLNSTISENSSAQFGAGMTLDNSSSATVSFSTIANNQGSGIDLVNGSTLSIGHTLLADNTRGNIPLSFANTTSLGYNITDDITVGLNQTTDRRSRSDAEINLAPLGDYGGPTETHALLPGSIAIDAGNPASVLDQDQRGVLRPVRERVANRVDVGAFEAARPILTVDPLITDDNTPELTGTVLLPGNIVDPDLGVTVTIDGIGYTAINNGDGTWTVDDGAIAPLADGTYNVIASATNISGTRTDTTVNELVVDATAPIVTVDTLFTNDPTPELTGTVDDDNAAITVTIDGVAYTATNNENGTWILEDGSITAALADGNYDIQVSATDAIGNVGTDATSDELTIDSLAPTVTVDSQITNDDTPSLVGEVDDPDATVQVLVNGVLYTATNNGDGTWELADGTITQPIPDGTYDVQVAAIDLAGNVGADNTIDELVIDTTPPEITIDPLTTSDATPELTGTVNEIDATIEVTVNGTLYTATNNGDGTWTLADDAIAPALTDATYDVVATATDAVGNVGMDMSVDELVIDTTPPVVTVDPLFTTDSTPELTGTVDDSEAIVTVVVDGETYDATNNGDGTWTLADDSITTLLADGIYDVQVTATDLLGNVGTDATDAELTIDTIAPTVTIESQVTIDSTPALSGTVDDPDAIVQVLVNGVTYDATNNGDGTWTLADDVIADAIPDGTYDVAVTATDLAGNVGTDDTADELTIDSTAPIITVDATITSDTTPEIMGAVSENDATIQVLINGITYDATNNGDGSWTLADDTIAPALADGTYDIVATATDSAGNVGTDDTTDELVIDAIAPVVTIDDFSTNDQAPALTGTVDDPTAVIQVTVDRDSYIATNNGDGTWSLDAGTFTLGDDSYEVEVAAIDAAGNVGRDTAILLIDSIAPIVTVDAVATNDATPELTGTVDDPTATITVTVDGNDYTATNNEDGTWNLADDRITPALNDGTFDISVTAEDAAGNASMDDTTDELLVDTVVPVVSVDALTTNDTTPELTGLVDDPNAIVEVTIRNTYTATNNGDGTWTLADDVIAPELDDGFYDVVAVAVDEVGNIGQDATNNELLIDATAPVVTVDPQLTTDTTPTLTGTVDDTGADIEVTLNGIAYTATNNADGTWSLDGNVIIPPLVDGVYDVEVSATDAVGNVGTDDTASELTIDTIAPVVTINLLGTNDSTPTLTGTIDDAIATLAVTVSGTEYEATNNGDGTWQLTVPDPLADGLYDVSVTATDLVGNASTDGSTDELFIDTVAPVITVNSLLTNDPRPALTGTINDPNAAVQVRVGGSNYNATNNGNGTWTLADNAINPALGENTFNVLAIATDAVGNVGVDQTTNELQIDLTPPLADIVNVTPDPRGPVDTVAIRFNSVVFGFDVADLVLERDGNPVSLAGANLETSDRVNWTLENLTGETTLTGLYTLRLNAAGSNIIDRVGNLLANSPFDTWQVNNFTVSGLPAPRSIGGRTGVPFPPIDFSGGRRGIREVGTNRRDVIRGTGRRDRLSGRRGGDRLLGRGGNDRLFGEGGTDTLLGGAGNDRLQGGGRRDRLEGQRGRDRLEGGRGVDTLLGGGGNDELIGGGGNDTLTGGRGNDVFVFDSLTSGVDTITDFRPVDDQIDLRGILSASQFAAASSFAKLSQFVRLQQVGSSTVVSIDADGNGSGEVLQPIILLENIDANLVVSTNFVV